MSNLKFNEFTFPDDENVYQVDQKTDSAINVAVTVGGISSGTTYVSGTRVDTILRDILEPTLYPTLTNPTASLAGSGSKLMEYGATQEVTLTITANRGSISPAYGTSGYRAGAIDRYQINNQTISSNTYTCTVSDNSARQFVGAVFYDQGEQPKDSKGNDYSSPLYRNFRAQTNTVEYSFVNAFWANTADITSIVKLPIFNYYTVTYKDFVFPAQTVANPEVLDIPSYFDSRLTAIQVKNDLSGAYEDASSQFDVTEVWHADAGGTEYGFKRYTFNMGMATGSRTVRIRWTN